jgi:uncharacterized protein
VNRNLACSGPEFQTDNLLFYDRKLPHLEIVKLLRRFEEKLQAEEVSKLKGMEISLDSTTDVINLDEVDSKHGVGLKAIKGVIKGQSEPGYSLLGDQLRRGGRTHGPGSRRFAEVIRSFEIQGCRYLF